MTGLALEPHYSLPRSLSTSRTLKQVELTSWTIYFDSSFYKWSYSIFIQITNEDLTVCCSKKKILLLLLWMHFWLSYQYSYLLSTGLLLNKKVLGYIRVSLILILIIYQNGWRFGFFKLMFVLNEVSPGSTSILVLGNEGTGLTPPLVEKSWTELVRISGNMPSSVAATESKDGEVEGFRSFLAVESLDVSVAASLFLRHLIGNKANCLILWCEFF